MATEDFYAILGVSSEATTEEIKSAFRKKAFDHHPDANQDASSSDRDQFQRVLRAYETLRDPAKRSTYDLLRLSKPSYSADSADAYWSPRGTTGDDWERAFDEWAKRMQDEFGSYGEEAEELKREREAAERIARAAAWEREKQAAVFNRLRTARVRQKTEDAKYTRHAATLRKFWQGRRGVTWQDAVAGILFLATTAGSAVYLKHHFRAHKEKEKDSSSLIATASMGHQPP